MRRKDKGKQRKKRSNLGWNLSRFFHAACGKVLLFFLFFKLKITSEAKHSNIFLAGGASWQQLEASGDAQLQRFPPRRLPKSRSSCEIFRISGLFYGLKVHLRSSRFPFIGPDRMDEPRFQAAETSQSSSPPERPLKPWSQGGGKKSNNPAAVSRLREPRRPC